MTGQEKEKRRTNDWRTFNEKRINQAKTGLFIQNLCETEHPGDYEHVGILIFEFRRDLGCLYEMAPVRIVIYNFPLGALTPKRPRQGLSYGKKRALWLLLPKASQGGNVQTKYTDDRNSPHNSKSLL